ncbi:MAG: Gfo/Idh/MocA family oxidoreductase [Planctomycetota bacterium]
MTKHRTRREFLTDTTGFAAATLLASHTLAASGVGGIELAFGAGVHRSNDDTIRLALVGSGSRGGGAATDALSVTRGPMQLVAMADVFEDRVKKCHDALTEAKLPGLDVPPERRFIGFDGYKHAMDCLKPGDVVILATPPAFRWVHFKYAIEKGLNVFMEKPVCVDGPTARKMLDLTEAAAKKNLRIAVGLMSRHSRAMQELKRRVDDGEIGEIVSQHGYRMQGEIATFRSTPKAEGVSDLEHQLRRFHSFLWASGGGFNDFFIHIIDQLIWMKGALPVKAIGLGGRHYRTQKGGVPYVDQNFDAYGIEYTYADGTKLLFDGRNMDGCQEKFTSYMLGTKGAAIASSNSDCGLPSKIHSRRDFSKESLTWTSEVKEEEENPYQNEWNDFVAAIRDGKSYNEAKYGIETTHVCSMGRMAAHTGQEVTYQQMLDCKHEFAPGVADLTLGSASPLPSDSEGKYPVPQPGILTDREY